MNLTPASHKPPKCGADGGLKCQAIPLLVSCGATALAMNDLYAILSACSFLLAPTKLVPRSL